MRPRIAKEWGAPFFGRDIAMIFRMFYSCGARWRRRCILTPPLYDPESNAIVVVVVIIGMVLVIVAVQIHMMTFHYFVTVI